MAEAGGAKRAAKTLGGGAASKRSLQVVAKTLSGLKGPQWKELSADKKRPHMQMARKILAAQARLEAGPKKAK
ncbi:MAG TPA: hypothetical protein VGG10_03285 [Rhizomicrobium sp.]|jgi:hypothetical protein